MKRLNKKEDFYKELLVTREITLDEFILRIKQLNTKQIVTLKDLSDKATDKVAAFLIYSSVIDEENNLIFTPDDVDSIVENIGFSNVQLLIEEIRKFNGLDEEKDSLKNAPTVSSSTSLQKHKK